MGYISGLEIMEKRGMDMKCESGYWDISEFQKVGLPIIVQCSACCHSMPLASDNCVVDDEEYVFCKTCAGE